MPHTLYDTIKSQRQDQQNHSRLVNRLMIAGYLHEQNCKKGNFEPEKMIKESIVPYRQNSKINGYLYVKGYFYIHLIESSEMQQLNSYMKNLSKLVSQGGKFHQSHKEIRIVYQSYESSEQLFKGYECDNTSQQSGPILIETDKMEEQILERSNEVYEFFEQGAKTKKINPSHRIGNMILLNNEDMSLLVSKQFMNLEEYLSIYDDEVDVTKQSDLNYPLPPNVFKMIEFMEISDDYKQFVQ